MNHDRFEDWKRRKKNAPDNKEVCTCNYCCTTGEIAAVLLNHGIDAVPDQISLLVSVTAQLLARFVRVGVEEEVKQRTFAAFNQAFDNERERMKEDGTLPEAQT